MSSIVPKNYSMILSVILIMSGLGFKTNAQSVDTDRYQYLSPVPNARMVNTTSSIIIRYGKSYSPVTSKNINFITVTGQKSGVHKGKLLFLEKNKTLTFKPSLPFVYGEKVTVELKRTLKLSDGRSVPYLNYSFTTTDKKSDYIANPLSLFKSDFTLKNPEKRNLGKPLKINHDSLPSDFPDFIVDYNNPTDGYLFFAPFNGRMINSPSYLIISDNYGIPVFYRKMPSAIFDFQKQNDGTISYLDYEPYVYFIMNNKYEIIDTISAIGYPTNGHELRVLENGHYLIAGADPETVRMDTIVSGGNPNAIVIGLILQELDENKNLVFQWRSWDHYQITDATYDINLTDSLIDYVHANAIETDYDGNILLSCRHMDEITKIDRTTGDIIWRWGGEYCKNNQFTFLNDPIGFSHQHSIRRLTNGNYIIFDNGNLHDPQFSRAVEYQMDETNRIVNMVWEEITDPIISTFAMGSVERLPNHNTLIGWGMNFMSPDIIEVGPDGTQKLTITFPDSLYGYRAFKYDWNTQYFTSSKDTLEFGIVPVGSSDTIPFILTNNNNESVEINSIYNRDSKFTFEQQLPIVIPANNSVELSVKFSPDIEGAFFDALHLRWDTEQERIAKVIYLKGYTDSIYTRINDDKQPEGFTLSQNYPNPFNPVSKIKYSIPHNSLVRLKVYDILGNEVKTLVNKEQPAGSYEIEFNGSDLASGIYFYRLNTGEFTSVKKMLLLK